MLHPQGANSLEKRKKKRGEQVQEKLEVDTSTNKLNE
jgi:hypothetical protein